MARNHQAVPAVVPWPYQDQDITPSHFADPFVYFPGHRQSSVFHQLLRGQAYGSSLLLNLSHLFNGDNLQGVSPATVAIASC
jgi:hypothetical protein